ncbi:hypothetical protein L211DRAFT_313815 [Terfezia boudieri ATCC MYA-4762]|uniref:Uncharacterized protein n=1 Tax=Terfezia boudieri ATCC MYA-4762 TaxID=1051890 RepID=A0A3N4LI97_9PEZI|nr:hypothetical protein L211DRAFT_313815 [Terfezia boudieri ATCC MYA-4762]
MFTSETRKADTDLATCRGPSCRRNQKKNNNNNKKGGSNKTKDLSANYHSIATLTAYTLYLPAFSVECVLLWHCD